MWFRGDVEWELPPRTRRIRHNPIRIVHKFGTTSAHAENTAMAPPTTDHRRNYLRARGEYCNACVILLFGAELPPRTRRILEILKEENKKPGTTSAHAENTYASGIIPAQTRNYLRARGEYPKSAGSFITWFSKMGQI